jgi:hypothetical protein
MAEITTPYSIGSIVTYPTNHLTSAEHFESVYLSGDPRFVTPLMIVTEVLLEKRSFSHPEKGDTDVKIYKYKCIWFSTRKFTILDSWLPHKQLTLVQGASEEKTIRISNKVFFSTGPLELQKRKSSFSSESRQGTRKVTPLLDFVSPVFEVIGLASYESKDPLFDSKTNERKRWTPTKIVKCKYYNSVDEKYSELLIPIEALSVVPTYDSNILKTVIEIKQNSDLCTIQTPDDYHIGFVDLVSSLLGEYRIQLRDLFTGKLFEIDLSTIEIIESLELTVDTKVPEIAEDEGDYTYHDVASFFDENEMTGVFKIKYRNRYGIETDRFILPIEIVRLTEDEDDLGYLRAFCLMRNAERFFKIDNERILSLTAYSDPGLEDIAESRRIE